MADIEEVRNCSWDIYVNVFVCLYVRTYVHVLTVHVCVCVCVCVSVCVCVFV